jgi:D-glycero-beta-D-manno-heptose 1-phosphate adenylyltransferase
MKTKKISEKILTPSDLGKIRENKKVIGFCDGSFDILHAGHVGFFEQCKSHVDVLVVGVGTDSTIKKIKGDHKPINPSSNRLFLVASNKDVDFVVLNNEKELEGKEDNYEIIKKLKPDIFLTTDNNSYLIQTKKDCNELGIELKIIPRFLPPKRPYSSTEIIEKLKNSS